MGISDEFNTCSAGLKEFRRFNTKLSEQEIVPALLSCSQGQMKLAESVMEALMASAPNSSIPLTSRAFITFFAQVSDLIPKLSYYLYTLFNILCSSGLNWSSEIVQIEFRLIFQICGVDGSYQLTKSDRLCLWILKFFFEGPLLGFGLVRRLIRKRILRRFETAQTSDVNGISDDLIEGLADPQSPVCPFVSRPQKSPPEKMTRAALERRRCREGGIAG